MDVSVARKNKIRETSGEISKWMCCIFSHSCDVANEENKLKTLNALLFMFVVFMNDKEILHQYFSILCTICLCLV